MLSTALFAGCGTSKWALDDVDYAAKYNKPYSPKPWKKNARMAKQMVDARHVAGKGGVFVGGAAQTDPLALGGELGVFYYPAPWISGRAGLSGLLTTTSDEGPYGGVNVGLRVQSPSRLAPFVGVGGYAGYMSEEVEVTTRTTFFSHETTTRSETAGFAAVYPELGVHFWLNGHVRLTASGAYYITSEGRNDDFWFFGLGLAVLLGD